jgi:hypothetical protein
MVDANKNSTIAKDTNTKSVGAKEVLLRSVPALVALGVARAFWLVASQPTPKTGTETTQILAPTALKAGTVYTMKNGDTIHFFGFNSNNQALIQVFQPNGAEVYAGPVPGFNGSNPLDVQIGAHTYIAFKLISTQTTPELQASVISKITYMGTLLPPEWIAPITGGILGAGIAASVFVHLLRSRSREKPALEKQLRK